MSLKSLLASGAGSEALAAELDRLSHHARVTQTRDLSAKDMRTLYEVTADAPPIDLDFFVPPETEPLCEVVHEGFNSLPLFRRFQKRFCRPIDDGPRLFGYNEGVTRSLIGPGYFQTRLTTGNPRWEERGPVVIDYHQIPDGAVDSSWPPRVPNSHGLQRFVYYRTRDFMRRVSRHVSIGAAFKGDKALGAYFVLVRDPE